MRYDLLSTTLTTFGIIIIFFIIVIGNGLIIWVILTDKRLKSVQYIFYASLTMADFLLGIIVLPFFLLNEIHGFWVLGDWLCTVWLSSDILLCTASILSLCLISMDRCCLVSYPGSTRSPKNAVLMVILIWFLALIISLPSFMQFKTLELNSTHQCEVNKDLGYAIYSSTGSFFLPLLFILVLNARIFQLTRKRAVRCRVTIKEPVETTDDNNKQNYYHNMNQRLTLPQAVVQERKMRLSRQRERKATLVLSLVVGAFVLCWLPFFVTYITKLGCDGCIPDMIFKAFVLLGYCNSAINPIIYTIFNQDFRDSLKQFFQPTCCIKLQPNITLMSI